MSDKFNSLKRAEGFPELGGQFPGSAWRGTSSPGGSTSLSFSGCPETFSGPSNKRPTCLGVTMAGVHPNQLNYCGSGTAGCAVLVQLPRDAKKVGIDISYTQHGRGEMLLRVFHLEEDWEEIPVL